MVDGTGGTIDAIVTELAAGGDNVMCTDPRMTTQAVIERSFELSTSKDSRAVSDCFAASYRAHFVSNPSWDTVATQWASAGPTTGLRITYGDTVNGCDRYGVAAQMATG